MTGSAGGAGEVPGVGDDRGEFSPPRVPAQLLTCSIAGGDEHCRIARSSRRRLRRDGVPGDLPAGVDDLLYREAGAVAEVVDAMFAGHSLLERPFMGVGQIYHVDVVADAGAIRGRPVLTEDHDLFTMTESDLEYEGDEVGLDGVPFAVTAVGAGDVEVPQAYGGNAVRGGVRADRMVDRKLRRTVGVGGQGGCLLGDRHREGLPIGGRRGREHQPRSSV